VIPAPRLRPERVDRLRLFLRTNRFRAAFTLGPPSFLFFTFLQMEVFPIPEADIFYGQNLIIAIFMDCLGRDL
jgi:hypothetical protein